MEKKSRLGRGLSSLLGSGPEEIVTAEETSLDNFDIVNLRRPDSQMFHVELSQIQTNPDQPRKEFSTDSLNSLADSLKVAGVIQPILVRKVGDKYEIIAGERRFRAAQIASLPTIPVIVREADESVRSQLALIENIHRENLNPIDRALAYKEMAEKLNLTHADIAAQLGEERSGVANYMRLLDLPPSCRELVRQGSVSVGHAKLLCGLQEAAEIGRLTQLVVTQHLSVRALEKMIKEGVAPPPPKPAKAMTPYIADVERQIARDLQMRAEVKPRKKGGRLVIHYGSLDQFDELMNKLGVKIED